MYNRFRPHHCGGPSSAPSTPPTTKTCPKCQTEIDRRALVCPACRSKQPKEKGLALVIVGALGFILIVGGANSGGKGSSKSPSDDGFWTTPSVGEELKDGYLKYVKDHRQGNENCKKAIADMAKYDIKWTDRTEFQYVNKYARMDGYVLLSGDNAQAQNGFGNWIRVNYKCLYDPTSKRVIEATMNNGRLPSNYAD
jgi:hypothetical protein